MKVHLESTTKIVQLVKDGVEVPARLWEGYTESGIRVQALITRIAVDQEEDTSAFESELEQCREPIAHQAFDLRLIL